MGCAITKSQHRIIDSSAFKQSTTSSIDILTSTNKLITHFTDSDCPKPKCIFIFGRSGSNKGEFIYELMSHQSQNIVNASKTRNSYEYVYLDVEDLISDHIKERIDHLMGSIQLSDDNAKDDTTNSKGIMKKSHVDHIDEEFVESNHNNRDTVKQYLTEFGNIVTHTWLLGLMEKEIDRQSNCGDKEKIFLISLIPNRLSVFRHCLYLKQPPNFSQFNADYIAVNLTQNSRRKKDLDLISSSSCMEEYIQNFLNYFQSHNKLIEVKIGTIERKQRIKINRSKNALLVKNSLDLSNVLSQSKKEEMELDISQFESTKNPDRSLMFVVNNQIDTGRDVLIIEDKEISSQQLRKFVTSYNAVQNT